MISAASVGRDLHHGTASREAAASTISIRGLSRYYHDNKALEAVDLDVRGGEFLTLLGPSGSGKSTLLMLLAGFTQPTAGSIRFNDREMVDVPAHRRDVGVVFQNYALFPHMSVGENIGYPLRMRRVPRREIEERVREALEFVRLPGMMARRIDELSGGQQQRVAIARATVFCPSILLMDEPLSALDKKLREEMQLELRNMHERLGITTIYVTHDQREALTVSDRIAVMNKGRIVQIDQPSVLYERPANRFVATFIGDSIVVDVPVREGTAYLGGTALPVPVDQPAPNGLVCLVARPEKLHVINGQAPPDHIVLKGRLLESIYQGDSRLVRMTLEDGTILHARQAASSGDGEERVPGTPLRLGIRGRDLLFIASDDRAEP